MSQAAANGLVGILYLLVQGAATLWMTPYLMHHLGFESYGLVPMSNSIVNYAGVISVGLQTSVSMHLTSEVARRGDTEAGDVLASSVLMAVALSGLVFIASLPLANLVGPMFRVPETLWVSASHFVVLNALAFSLGLVASIFGAVAFSRSRVDLQSGVRFLELAIRFGVPVAAFQMGHVDLEWVGIGLVGGALATLCGSIALWRYLSPSLRLRASRVRWAQVKRLLATGGWTSLNQAGAILHLSTDVIVIGAISGAGPAGIYGALMQWAVFLRSAASAAAAGTAPHVTVSHATGRTKPVVMSTRSLSRITGLACGIVAGLLAGTARWLVPLWLGPQATPYWPVLTVMMLALPLNLSAVPQFSVQTAADKVAAPAVVTLATGIVNVALSIMWIGWRPIGIGVATATFVALSLKNAVFTPLHTAGVLGVSPAELYASMIPGPLFGIGVASVAALWTGWFVPTGWLELAVSFAAIGAPAVVLAWFVGLDVDARNLVGRVAGRRRVAMDARS